MGQKYFQKVLSSLQFGAKISILRCKNSTEYGPNIAKKATICMVLVESWLRNIFLGFRAVNSST